MRTVLLNWQCRYFNPHLPLEIHLLHASIDLLAPLPIEKSTISLYLLQLMTAQRSDPMTPQAYDVKLWCPVPSSSCPLSSVLFPPCRAVALAKAGASNLKRSAPPTSNREAPCQTLTPP